MCHLEASLPCFLVGASWLDLPILLTHFVEAHGTWEERFRILENVFTPTSQLIGGLAPEPDVFRFPFASPESLSTFLHSGPCPQEAELEELHQGFPCLPISS